MFSPWQPCRSSFAPWPQRQWAGVHGKRPSRCRRWRWRPSPVSDGATMGYQSSMGISMGISIQLGYPHGWTSGARSLISRTWRIWRIWSLPGADRNLLMKWCPLVFGMLILLSHSGTRANVASSVKIRAGDTATARWMDRWMDRWIGRISYQ